VSVDLGRIIKDRSKKLLGYQVNLANPVTFNDKINWCKLYDQVPESVQAVDKVGVFDYLKDRNLDQYNRKLIDHATSLNNLTKSKLQGQCVFKCNHDSGTTKFVDCDKPVNWTELNNYYTPKLKREYGLRNAEWQYAMIKPEILVERRLPGEVPADYKFHCGNGEVFWCQYIYDRFKKTSEVNVLPDGSNTGILFDTNFKLGSSFTKPKTWDEMIELAKELSKPYKYVRVDLFSVDDTVYFGELTFFPRGGFYKGEGEKKLGQLITLDTTTTKPMVFK